MKPVYAVAAGLAAIALVGCAAGHSHSLIPDESDRSLTLGMFHHLGPEEPAMMLELKGKRYEARGFAIQRTQNLAELRRRYGPGRHYDRILSGSDTDHYVYAAEPELRAGDGARLRCALAWREAATPAGICTTAEGTRMDVRFD